MYKYTKFIYKYTNTCISILNSFISILIHVYSFMNSLTSVEMVWKVSDVALTKSKREKDLSSAADESGGMGGIGFEIYRMMAVCLDKLSLDLRPEVHIYIHIYI
jgi:hypothetical protein